MFFLHHKKEDASAQIKRVQLKMEKKKTPILTRVLDRRVRAEREETEKKTEKKSHFFCQKKKKGRRGIDECTHTYSKPKRELDVLNNFGGF